MSVKKNVEMRRSVTEYNVQKNLRVPLFRKISYARLKSSLEVHFLNPESSTKALLNQVFLVYGLKNQNSVRVANLIHNF